MKKLRILFFCCGLILSSCAFAESKAPVEIKILPAASPVQNEIPNVFRSIGNFFKRLFGKNRQLVIDRSADVTNLNLDKTKVFSTCPADGKSCADNIQMIEVSTEINKPEPELLTYHYQVTGGKIVGTGAKVVWDLSGAKPGTYTITAGVDDGCGVCGRMETKQITVIECKNCN
jgi:hypothetical protein